MSGLVLKKMGYSVVTHGSMDDAFLAALFITIFFK